VKKYQRKLLLILVKEEEVNYSHLILEKRILDLLLLLIYLRVLFVGGNKRLREEYLLKVVHLALLLLFLLD
jgi:hypothetical protein